MNINSAIGEIINSQKEAFKSIVIRIECPLTTGIRVSSKMTTANGVKSIPLACGSRPLFNFAKSEKETYKKDFNVIVITVQPNGTWSMMYDYDAELQKHAQEMTN